jgi:hypothetical protein
VDEPSREICWEDTEVLRKIRITRCCATQKIFSQHCLKLGYLRKITPDFM